MYMALVCKITVSRKRACKSPGKSLNNVLLQSLQYIEGWVRKEKKDFSEKLLIAVTLPKSNWTKTLKKLMAVWTRLMHKRV